MEDRIIWACIGIIASFIGTFLSNWILKRREFNLSWRKLEMEKMQELYGLVTELNEQNRKLFKGTINPDHYQLKNKFTRWLSAYKNSRLFLLKNSIILSSVIKDDLNKNIANLHNLAVKIMLQKNALDELEGISGGIKSYMYSDEQSEFLQSKKSIDQLATEENLEHIIININLIINNIDSEFRKLRELNFWQSGY